MTDIDPDQGRLGGGGASPQPPGPAPEGFVPAARYAVPSLPVRGGQSTSPISPAHSGEGGSFLDRPGIPPTTKLAASRWFFYALFGFLAGQIIGLIFGTVAGDIAGKSATQMTAIEKAASPPEWYVISTLVGLWIGFLGAPWLASRTHGTRRFLSDLGVRFRWIDLWGLAIGVAAQYAIALIYWPFQRDIHNFNGPGQKLTGGAHGAGVVVVVVATVIAVPFMEELFFRGLLFKSLARLFTPLGPGVTWARGGGVVLAVIVDGLLFGLAHAEWVQFAGLALFGVLQATISYRTGRLGMNMLTHATFNLVAVVSILNSPGGIIH